MCTLLIKIQYNQWEEQEKIPFRKNCYFFEDFFFIQSGETCTCSKTPNGSGSSTIIIDVFGDDSSALNRSRRYTDLMEEMQAEAEEDSSFPSTSNASSSESVMKVT